MSRLVLIDGNAILHRAFHAMPPLTTSKGELVNAVFGFTSILLKIFEELRPECVAVCFDKKAPTFRKKHYADYQAKRPKMVDELVGQIERVHQVVRTMNMPIFELDGWEADDVIGTLVKQVANVQKTRNTQSSRKSENQKIRKSDSLEIRDSDSQKVRPSEFSECSGEGIETIIVTGDRDLLQLVDEHTKVYLPVKGLSQAALLDREGVFKKMGVWPEQIPDLKGLIGDASDNYPGVSGIGPKTATDLLTKYKTLKDVYKNLENLPPKITQKLKEGKKDADMSYFLATIIKDVPVKLEMSKCKLIDYDWQEVVELFDELEFRSLIPRLPKDIHDIEKPFSSAKKVEDKKKQDDGQMGLF